MHAPQLLFACLQDAELRNEAVVYLSNGDSRVFFFERTGQGVALRSQFERPLNDAVEASQKERDDAELRRPAQTADAEQPAAPAEGSAAGSSQKKRRVETRDQKGAELRAVLRDVTRLRYEHKQDAASEKLESVRTGEVAGQRTISNRSREVADVLFKAGGLETTRAVLLHVLDRSDVKELLPDAVAKSRAKAADARTAAAMLEAAKAFFNQLMGRRKWVEGRWARSKIHQGMTWQPGHWAYGGRRTDADRNAFWASAAAMLPRDIFKSRGGKAAMRILGVSYRVVKQAAAYRAEMEDRGRGWKLLKTKPHSDRVEGTLITQWWHTEDASTEDNQNKQPIRVFHGFNEAGERR
jgi:hypothetical protein